MRIGYGINIKRFLSQEPSRISLENNSYNIIGDKSVIQGELHSYFSVKLDFKKVKGLC